MIEDNKKLEEFLTQLSSAVKDPAQCTGLLKKHRLDGKLRRALEKEQRERVAMAFAVHSEAEVAGTLDQLVAAIKTVDTTIKSNDNRLVVLHSLIEYGKSGKQYASRDKAVMQFLELRESDYSSAAETIKSFGGLVECAGRWRRETRGDAPKAKKHNADLEMAVLLACPNLSKGDAVAVLVTVSKPGKLSFVRAQKIPLSTDPTNPEDESADPAATEFDHLQIMSVPAALPMFTAS